MNEELRTWACRECGHPLAWHLPLTWSGGWTSATAGPAPDHCRHRTLVGPCGCPGFVPERPDVFHAALEAARGEIAGTDLDYAEALRRAEARAAAPRRGAK